MLYSVAPLIVRLGVSRFLSLGLPQGESVQKKNLKKIKALKGNIQLEITRTENGVLLRKADNMQ
jgi:hypothetical protein